MKKNEGYRSCGTQSKKNDLYHSNSKRERGKKVLLKAIITENFPNLGTEMDIQIHKAQNRLNLDRATLRHIIIKLSKVQRNRSSLVLQQVKNLVLSLQQLGLLLWQEFYPWPRIFHTSWSQLPTPTKKKKKYKEIILKVVKKRNYIQGNIQQISQQKIFKTGENGMSHSKYSKGGRKLSTKKSIPSKTVLQKR